ncbi:hypothetical protein GGR54DRAFT_624026 [Hypoxylon sp. NC1633]|nr:hypothetical protein GGR54DRAFT_624026 [Hypoxylon sp. NC1633]
MSWTGSHFLKRALRLAQEIFYHGTQKYVPKLANDFRGPHEVRFGWAEMNQTTDRGYTFEGITTAGKSHPPYRVLSKIRIP